MRNLSLSITDQMDAYDPEIVSFLLSLKLPATFVSSLSTGHSSSFRKKVPCIFSHAGAWVCTDLVERPGFSTVMKYLRISIASCSPATAADLLWVQTQALQRDMGPRLCLTMLEVRGWMIWNCLFFAE